ncbi:MAG: hypothetical protein ACREVL_01885, partial [Solimonas sp.]
INTDRGLIYGVELDSAGALGVIGWQLGGTWQHTEDRSDISDARGRQLPGRFETQLNARLEYGWRNVVLYYAYRYEAGQYYDSASLLKAPEMQRHDAGLRGEVRRVGWAVQALNLGDDQSEQFNGFPTPGRRYLLTLSYPNTEATVARNVGRAVAAARDPATEDRSSGSTP